MTRKIVTFCFCHTPLSEKFPKNENFKFVQCGSLNNRFEGYDFYDDSENNSIRDLNWYFSEGTGINFIVNNKHTYENSDYVGFAHYRRYLDFSTEELSQNTIICRNENFGTSSVYDQYRSCVGTGNAFDIFVDLARERDNGMLDGIVSWFMGSNNLYSCNLFAMSKKLFEEYSEFVKWFLPIVEKLHRNNMVDISNFSNYQKRYVGLLFERLTSYWIYFKRNNGVTILNRGVITLPISNGINSGW